MDAVRFRIPLCCLAAFLGMGSLTSVAFAETLTPAPVLPEQLRWISPPALPALQSAWVLGAETQSDLYLIRVKLALGGRIPPHTHPDKRMTTVLSGTLYVGFGTVWDESKIIAVPAGAVYAVPERIPHYLWAKDSAVIYQETGLGPTGTAFVSAPLSP